MNTEIKGLEKRIQRLESQNRRLRWVGLFFIGLVATTAVWGQRTGSVELQAQKFELRDDAGRLRAELSMLNGGPALRFFGEHNDGESLLNEDSFTIFKNGGDIRAAYAAEGLSIEDGHDKVFVTLGANEGDQMGKLRINDYRHKIYAVVNAEDLAKVHSDKP
jgi:hypothetical protein